jgi:hypothetical protein
LTEPADHGILTGYRSFLLQVGFLKMKQLVLGLLCAVIALSQHPKVSECFKVNEMIRADEEHYWTTWTNTCPYTIDSVYVLVGFADRSSRELADGVWSLHFIAPGAHRTVRFSAPGKLADFASVHQRKITGDMNEAFGKEKQAMSSVEIAAVSAYREAIAKDGNARPRVTQVSTIIGDAGEAAYRDQPAAESVAAAAFGQAILKYVLATTSMVQAAPVARSAYPIGDPGEALFRTDFPDPWQAVLSPLELTVSPAPRPSFVRFVTEDKPIFQ